MLVMIVVLFVFCWAPALIDQVLVAFEVVNKYNYGYMRYLRQMFAILSYSNSCVNPIVYAFMSKNFRESFKHTMNMVCRRCWGRAGSSNSHYQLPANSTYQTRTTSMSMSMTTVRHEPGLLDQRLTLTAGDTICEEEEKAIFTDGDTVM